MSNMMLLILTPLTIESVPEQLVNMQLVHELMVTVVVKVVVEAGNMYDCSWLLFK